MRIAYVLSRFPVLSQTFVMNEIVELIEKGHEVVIFSLSRPSGAAAHPEVAEYRLIERTRYAPVIGSMSSNAGDPRPGIAAMGSQIYGANSFVGSLLSQICGATVAVYFASLARRMKVDVLHAHFYGLASALAALISGRTGIPFTYTCHAVDIFVAPCPQVMRRHMQAAFKVITPSDYNKEYLCHLTDMPADKIEVIRACHLIDKFKHVVRHEHNRTIISTGRLVAKKGLITAILAVHKLRDEFPDLRYLIIGDGPEKTEIIRLVKCLKLEGNVELLEETAHDAFMSNLSKSSFMVLPCIRTIAGDMDVCPLVLQEAMCARLPVLSTKISAIPELIEDGVEGYIVPPGDVNKLAGAMRSLLINSDLRERMGQAGRRKMEEKFNIHKEVDKLLSIWAKAVETRSQ